MHRPDYASGHLLDHKFDEKGRLTKITSYYQYTPQPPGAKGIRKHAAGLPYDGDSSIIQLAYNNMEHTIRVFNEYGSETTYYLNRKSRVAIEGCNAEAVKASKEFCNGPRSKTITILDRKLRIKSVSEVIPEKGLCLKCGSPYIVYRYRYNKRGLLMRVNNTDKRGGIWKQKIFFYYLDESMCELR